MGEKILFVDDDLNVLSAFRRTLRGRFQIETADSAAKALAILERDPSFAVIVSDYRMPQINGVEFLAQAAARWPDCVRILLTGEADTKAAGSAVNQGQIFRFLLKPCAPLILEKTLKAGLQRHHFLTGERSLLEQTLRSSMELLVDLLKSAHPLAFPESDALYQIMCDLLRELPIEDKWEFELAALLSEIGNISLPQSLLKHVAAHELLSPAERDLYNTRNAFAEHLLETIPRLELVAKLIGAQDQPPPQLPARQSLAEMDRLHLGTNLLKLAHAWYNFSHRDLPNTAFLVEAQSLGFAPNLIKAAEKLKVPETAIQSHSVHTSRVEEGMALESDLVSDAGVLLLTKGQTLSPLLVECLHRRSSDYGVDEEVLVHDPPPADASETQDPAKPDPG